MLLAPPPYSAVMNESTNRVGATLKGMALSFLKNLRPALLARSAKPNFGRPGVASAMAGIASAINWPEFVCTVIRLGGLQMRWVHLIALVIGIMAILGVFIEIPFVSEYAFWVMTAAFLMLASLRW
jgi:hypothetical protein